MGGQALDFNGSWRPRRNSPGRATLMALARGAALRAGRRTGVSNAPDLRGNLLNCGEKCDEAAKNDICHITVSYVWLR
jgi:hypothetical protein